MIKHFCLLGGFDDVKFGGNDYTEFAMKIPQDTVILTLTCGKFRFNQLDLGDIGDIKRLLESARSLRDEISTFFGGTD